MLLERKMERQAGLGSPAFGNGLLGVERHIHSLCPVYVLITLTHPSSCPVDGLVGV